MNSNYLKEEGFSKICEFSPEKILESKYALNSSGIYCLVLNNKFDRLKGKTDILYIGQSGGRNGRTIFERLRDYVRAYESAPQDKRIFESILKIKTTKKRIGSLLHLKVFDRKVFIFTKKVSNKEDCFKTESELLSRFFEDHIELPPFNRRK